MSSRRTSRRAPTPVIEMPTTPASRPERPPSPLSPTRQSREVERRSMQNLNDRLAVYIDAVRSREAEIQSLKQERSIIEDTHSTEIIQTKTMYNKEIGHLRKALDKTTSDNSRLQMEKDKLAHDSKEGKNELVNKLREHDLLDRNHKALQANFNDVSARCNDAENELSNLRPDNAKLLKRLEDSKRTLEDETLKRVDLQNQLLSVEEHLKFENQMLEQRLNETRVRKQMEISEIDGKLTEKYEAKMHQSLAELRETYDKQSKENQEEFSKVYDDKIKNLQASLDKEKVTKAGREQEVREMITKVSALTSRNVELEGSNASLQKRMAELQAEMDDLSARMRAEMAAKDAEVRNKDDQMDAMTKDYKELMEIKIALDMEIAAYSKLLQGEEARLGLSASGSPEAAVAPPRGIKRKRTIVEEEEVFDMVSEHSGPGNAVIEPLKKGAKFVRIFNKSLEDLSIGGWTMSNEANGQETAYKFHRSTVMKPGDMCTVYSSDSGEVHTPPNTLVMKKGGWVISGENVTKLINKEGEEEATRTSWEQKRQGSLYRSGVFAPGTVDPDDPNNSKSCAIM